MKLKNKIIIIVTCAIILTTAVIILLVNYIKVGQEEIAKCPYFDNTRYNKDVSFVSCFGIFSIENESPWLDDKRLNIYNIRDDKHNYNISKIDDLKNYKISGDNLYIYEPIIFQEEEYTHIKYGDNPWQYPQEFFINGEIKEINYNSPKEFPNYIQIEMSTGEVTLYNNYDQMPETAKKIFSELENLTK